MIDKNISAGQLQDIFAKLAEPFSDEDLEWKVQAMKKEWKKALVTPYIRNPSIMQRLDEVVGPANWKNEFLPGPNGGTICGISIRINDEWVTKYDGADNTDVEAVKGGLTSAMKRAAVQWGIGRYLYGLENIWVPKAAGKDEPDWGKLPPTSQLLKKRKGESGTGNGKTAAEHSVEELLAKARAYKVPNPKAVGLPESLKNKTLGDIEGDNSLGAASLAWLSGRAPDAEGSTFDPKHDAHKKLQAAAAYILDHGAQK